MLEGRVTLFVGPGFTFSARWLRQCYRGSFILAGSKLIRLFTALVGLGVLLVVAFSIILAWIYCR